MNALSFQCEACLPSPWATPVDMSHELDVSLVTEVWPGRSSRGVLVKAAALLGVFAMLKRNRSSGNTLTTKGCGRVSMKSTLEMNPNEWPISCKATLSKSMPVTPSDLS